MRNPRHVPSRKAALLLLAALVAGCRGQTAAPPGPAGPQLSGREARPGPTLGSGHYPQPAVGTWHGCGPEGDGGDRELNRHKNRTDEGDYQPVTLSQLLALRWPREIERRHRDEWSNADAAQVARYEGAPVAVEAFLYGAKLEGPESTNCHSNDPAERDFHLWITESSGAGRENAMVVEMTPRVREGKPGWTVENLARIAQAGQQVRVSGWLMMDQEHPEQLGNTRGTLWEIHPIMRFDYADNGRWIDLATGRPSSGARPPGAPGPGGPGRMPPGPGPAAPSRARPTTPPREPTSEGSERVWVNTRSGVYHRPGSPYYGQTKRGEYMTEAEARARGYHAAKGEE